jgi:hypothetical protein
LRVRVPDGEPVLRLEMGNNKETRRRPVSSHPEGVVSFAGERWACTFLIEVNQSYILLGLFLWCILAFSFFLLDLDCVSPYTLQSFP